MSTDRAASGGAGSAEDPATRPPGSGARSRGKVREEKDRVVRMGDDELRRVAAFVLRDAAERIVALSNEAQPTAIRSRLLVLATQLGEQARLLEEDGA